MIGYYVHHVGRGHAHRAAAIAKHLPGGATVLSSLAPPEGWPHDWIVLPRDDADPHPKDPTAGGALHWAPRHDGGLQGRMRLLANWLADHNPAVLVSDLSVEVVVLARVLGIPTVTIALPGLRNDAAHQLGYDLADAIIAPWPRLDDTMCLGLERHSDKVHYVGGLSRFDGRPNRRAPARQHRQVLALGGVGGERNQLRGTPVTPGWRWTSRGIDHWISDPWPELCEADVVVTHCGLGALSDVAAARRPAVLLPEPRPHGEQMSTARALAAAGLGVVLDHEPDPRDWPPILARALQTDGSAWSAWSSGNAAEQAAAVIAEVAAA
jgi:hypothetical protein